MTRNQKETGERGPAHAASETNDKTRPSDQAGTTEGTPQSDARGAGKPSLADATNDGVVSTDPRVLSGKKSGDATFRHRFDGIDKE